MLRFFVLGLLAVHLVLVEGRRAHRKEVIVRTHKTPVDTKAKEQPTRPTRLPVLRKEVTTQQVSNRHRRALPEPPAAKEEDDPRPCVLHSFRYGCICRYGDFKCSPYPPEYPLL